MIRAFLRWNVRCSNWIEERLPRAFVGQLLVAHAEIAAEAINGRPHQVVLDVGAGSMCPFAKLLHRDREPYIIGTDVSWDQLSRNGDVDCAFVADARHLPLRPGTVDVLATRSVLEHMQDVPGFVSESAQVLKAGGLAIHVFPGRYAPFAILNRLMPERLKRQALLLTRPKSQGRLGFPAYYNYCSEPQMVRLLQQCGFEVEVTKCHYYQSIYFKPLVLIYLISVLYDLLVSMLRIRALASQVLIVARNSDIERHAKPERLDADEVVS
jgi:SAM-dependent methyltransferase